MASLGSTDDVLAVIAKRVYHTLDQNGEFRAVDLDILKVVDKAWHAGHLWKLKGYGILGEGLI